MFVVFPIIEYDIANPFTVKLVINLVNVFFINRAFLAVVLAITFVIMGREDCGVATLSCCGIR